MREIRNLGAGYSFEVQSIVNEEIDGHPLWISRFIKTNPNALQKTFLRYLNAGADVLNTLTYQASVPGFMKAFGLDEGASYDLIKESVRIVRRAVEEYMKANPKGKKPLLVGGAGSYGAFLNDGSEYDGSFVERVRMEDLIDWHRPRVKALIEEGVDIIAFETIPALAEAKAALQLMKEFPQQKIWVSFQCKDSEHTAFGDDFKRAVKECWEMSKHQLVAVGCNCVSPTFVTPLLTGINEPGNIKIPLVVYPNSGEAYSTEKKKWHGDSKWGDFDVLISEWLDLGVTFVGGCCKTDLTYIPKISAAIRKWQRKE